MNAYCKRDSAKIYQNTHHFGYQLINLPIIFFWGTILVHSSKLTWTLNMLVAKGLEEDFFNYRNFGCACWFSRRNF